MRKPPRDMAASVRGRLQNLSQKKDCPFDLLLTHYAIERLLYRLSESDHADRFVLKGGMLLMTWFGNPVRVTRDLDLLGYGDLNPEEVKKIFEDILGRDYPDGVRFDHENIRIARIRQANEHGGARMRATAFIGTARIAVNVDIGMGDAAVPEPRWRDYPVLLDNLPAPRLRCYAPETVIAEKFHAIVELGTGNSRLKDFYDLWVLDELFEFDRSLLAKAVSATFARRRTPIPDEVPRGLSDAFAQDPVKQAEWNEFRRTLSPDPGPLAGVIEMVRAFAMPVADAARRHDGGRGRPEARERVIVDPQDEADGGLPTPLGTEPRSPLDR